MAYNFPAGTPCPAFTLGKNGDGEPQTAALIGSLITGGGPHLSSLGVLPGASVPMRDRRNAEMVADPWLTRRLEKYRPPPVRARSRATRRRVRNWGRADAGKRHGTGGTAFC